MRKLVIGSFALLAALLVAVLIYAPAPSVRSSPETAQPAAESRERLLRKPSAQAVSQWLRTSSSSFAAKAADYELDAPRKRNKLGQVLPFRELPVASRLMASLRQAQPGDMVKVRLFDDAVFELQVTGRWEDADGTRISARTSGGRDPGTFFMSWGEDSARGLLLLPSLNLAYEIVNAPSGAFIVREWLHNDVMCSVPAVGSATVGIPRPAATPVAVPPSRITPGQVPLRNSRPGSVGVIYLDFDGELVSGTAWNDGVGIINAPAARLSAAQINEVWERVSRDFNGFDVNVTTDLAVYRAAPANRRTHCVISENDAAAPGAGGVAFLDSFARSDQAFKICWAFIDDDARNCAIVISHEIGHTLDLRHDGRVAAGSSQREEYYFGHGTGPTGWAPVMGAGYSRQLVQWSKGEYARANNQEDDLAIMTTANRVPYVADDHGNTLETATTIGSNTTVNASIERTTDVDVYRLQTGVGEQPVSVTLPVGTMLDVQMEILDERGTVLATVNPADDLSASTVLNFTTSRTVYVRVRGTGKPEVLGVGYSNYSSLGSYVLTVQGPKAAITVDPPGLVFVIPAGSAGPSAAKPLVVSGLNLEAPVDVEVSGAFEVSTDGATFTSALQLSPGAGGFLTPQTLYVRMTDDNGTGVQRGSLTLSSAPAPTQTVGLAGTKFGELGSDEAFVAEIIAKFLFLLPEDPLDANGRYQFGDSWTDLLAFLEGRLAAGVAADQARAEAVARLTGFNPYSGIFDRQGAFAPLMEAYSLHARLGLVPTAASIETFVRTARTGNQRRLPVPATINDIADAPWEANYALAAAVRDVLVSKPFRDRHAVSTLSTTLFLNWLQDTMFPGQGLGLEGSAALIGMMNPMTIDPAQGRSFAQGAAIAFRLVYASVLLTEARGSSNGSQIEAPLQRRLAHAALNHLLWGEWSYSATSTEFGATSMSALLRAPAIKMTAPPELQSGAAFGGYTVPVSGEVTFFRATGLPPWLELDAASGVIRLRGDQSVVPEHAEQASYTVSVTAGNLLSETTAAVMFTVRPSPVTSQSARWLASHGLQGADMGSGADGDGDGFCLMTEYAFASNPQQANGSLVRFERAGPALTMKWTGLAGKSYRVQSSTNLAGNWLDRPDLPVQAGGPVAKISGADYLPLQAVLPVGTSGREFYRVKTDFGADEFE